MDSDAHRFVAIAVTDEVDESGRTRPKLVGPLALACQTLAERQPALHAALRVMSAGRFGRDRTLLEVETRLGEGKNLDVHCRGPLAPFVGERLVKGFHELLARHDRPIRTANGQMSFTLYQPPVPSEANLKVMGNVVIGRVERGRPRITTATLQVTARCQADCIHCSAAKHRDREREELTTEEWKRIIRETEQLGVVNIVFTGGEPLLRRDIYELIAWVDRKEAEPMMFTNGLMLTQEVVDRLAAAGLYGCNVSLDSPDEAEHDAMRRVPGCFRRAAEGLQRLKAAGILTGISTYATPQRVRTGKVRQLVELGREWGVHEMTIFDTVPTGRLLHEDESGLLTDEDKAYLIDLEEEINAKPDYPAIITQAKINGPRGTGCFAGWYQFYMTAYGDVMPCDFTPLSFGNVRKEALSAIWDRLISHPAYRDPCNHCRMQDPQFRAAFINRIPDEGPFPYPAELLDLTGRAEEREAMTAGRPG